VTSHNLDVIAALLVSLSAVSVLAFLSERRANRKAPVVALPDRSNVTRLHRRNGATVVRIGKTQEEVQRAARRAR
jgi:hypothetical protein